MANVLMQHDAFFPAKPGLHSTDSGKHTWMIVGAGESAKHFPFHRFEGIPILAINNAWKLCKANALYACDPEWWEYYGEDAVLNGPALRYSQFPSHDRQQMTMQWNMASRFKVFLIPGVFEIGLSKRPDLIHYNGHGGAQAINLAACSWGAKRLLLVGFDMKGDHFHDPHPPGVARPIDFAKCLERFTIIAADLAALGIAVFNLNPDSAIQDFMKMTPEDYLRERHS